MRKLCTWTPGVSVAMSKSLTDTYAINIWWTPTYDDWSEMCMPIGTCSRWDIRYMMPTRDTIQEGLSSMFSVSEEIRGLDMVFRAKNT